LLGKNGLITWISTDYCDSEILQIRFFDSWN
jgi:hypothetical protein